MRKFSKDELRELKAEDVDLEQAKKRVGYVPTSRFNFNVRDREQGKEKTVVLRRNSGGNDPKKTISTDDELSWPWSEFIEEFRGSSRKKEKERDQERDEGRKEKNNSRGGRFNA